MFPAKYARYIIHRNRLVLHTPTPVYCRCVHHTVVQVWAVGLDTCDHVLSVLSRDAAVGTLTPIAMITPINPNGNTINTLKVTHESPSVGPYSASYGCIVLFHVESGQPVRTPDNKLHGFSCFSM